MDDSNNKRKRENKKDRRGNKKDRRGTNDNYKSNNHHKFISRNRDLGYNNYRKIPNTTITIDNSKAAQKKKLIWDWSCKINK